MNSPTTTVVQRRLCERSQFPDETYKGTNYYVDPIFVGSAASPPP